MADQSFSDIRQQVRDALASVDKDKGDDLVVVDQGSDWVVYQDPDTVGAGLFKRGYKLANGKVTLTGDPVKVVKQTSYVPVGDKPAEDQPKNLRDAGREARRQIAEGRKSGS